MAYKNLAELLKDAPHNDVVVNNLIKAYSIINNPLYSNKIVSISGGADSDVVLDIVKQCCDDARFVFFDTGLEYKATKSHLDFLEDKYGIKIERLRLGRPIPTVCKEKGQPFLSKQVSEYIERLQKHNFKFEDKTFKELLKEYPNSMSALKWWCNMKAPNKCISYNKYLKEFLIAHPPTFKISNKCCLYSKKKPLRDISKSADLNICGIRKAEGGLRTAIKNCFSEKEDGASEYRPIFFYKDSDKQEYCQHYGITHSDCYSEYGLKRTGCAGCPFGRDFEFELEVIQKYEPQLYKMATTIFKDSYEFTRQYRKFVIDMDKKKNGQMDIYDFI